MKTQLTISQMERIIAAAKEAKKYDTSLSETIEIEVTSKSDTHEGGDWVGVELKSGYAECVGKTIFWNR